MPIEVPLAQKSVVPVVTFSDVSEALPCVDALASGGINQIEITLRSPAALDCIAVVVAQRPDFVVAAGTVLTKADLEDVRQAGAAFAFSPGFSEELCTAADKLSVPYLPAVSTVSELMAAFNLGYRLVKVFPAKLLGGLNLLRAWHGPLPDMQFCPTGGLSVDDVAEYFSFAPVAAIGGSWLVSSSDLQKQDWDSITQKAKQASAII